MKNIQLQRFKALLVLGVAFCSALSMSARPNVANPGGHTGTITYIHNNTYKVDGATCQPGTAEIDLDINDVRAKMLDDGDMWWNLTQAWYIVPKVDPSTGAVAVSSQFAGAIWVGGYDKGGNLRIAAATYRQNGNDWYPGYLDNSGSVTNTICSEYDTHFQVFGSEITSFLAAFASSPTPGFIPPNQIPADILHWPGRGNTDPTVPIPSNINMAPFFDKNHNNIYEPDSGEYPIIETTCAPTYADQMIWWVDNDMGNVHSETGGQQIGLEMQTLAFAYQTNDEFNDMTFYRYTLTNKSTNQLDSTFMAQWDDFDLGWAFDDYTGCDSAHSMGIGYNGKSFDGPAAACYGNQPPMIGTAYFEGPKNQNGKQLGLTSFAYYVNDFSVEGNPVGAQAYYNYISGSWTDGTPFTIGGNGYGGSVKTKFMFPGDPTDNSRWSECSAKNAYGDRRFIEASGPFTLVPGAVNNITIGVVWTRPAIGTYPCPSFSYLSTAYTKAQALFDNCFSIFEGPPSPNLNITELDQELIINMDPVTSKISESYSNPDPTLLKQGQDTAKASYKFQGYQIYQVSASNVTASYANLTDLTQARLIAQCDIKDGIGKIINYTFDPATGVNLPSIMVNGADKGIQHSFHVTTDQFASGSSSQLVNLEPYYFLVITYAYCPYYGAITGINAQGTPNLTAYLAGSKNVVVYTAIPHKPQPEFSGQVLNSVYGDAPRITRIAGAGSGEYNSVNGRATLDITPESEDTIVQFDSLAHVVYQENRGPIQVQVVDPKKVLGGTYQLTLSDTLQTKPEYATSFVKDASHWVLKHMSNGVVDDSVVSQDTMNVINQQIIPDWGISVTVVQSKGIWNNGVSNPKGKQSVYSLADNNGYVEATLTYSNVYDPWLASVPFQDNQVFGWIDIRSAPNTANPYSLDSGGVYRTLLGGSIAPFKLATATYWSSSTANTLPVGVAPLPGSLNASLPTGVSKALTNVSNPNSNTLGLTTKTYLSTQNLSSIDIVLTPDQTKWSKCIVMETDPNGAGKGGAPMMTLRDHASWTGSFSSGQPLYGSDMGYSYFPGYAIDLETGKRLNIFFGEDSNLGGDNGDDMLWNPTSNATANGTQTSAGLPYVVVTAGGGHWVYITGQQYDGCHMLHDSLTKAAAGNFTGTTSVTNALTWAYSQINWAWMPYAAGTGGITINTDGSFSTNTNIVDLGNLAQGVPPSEVKVRLRVQRPYSLYNVNGNSKPTYQFALDSFATTTKSATAAKSALDLVNIVPNPYYGYSNYEQNELDYEVKITNLPQNATIDIYTINGTLVRNINFQNSALTYTDNNTTWVNWDLKNNNGIVIGSGIYLIHINAPGIGEKVIKWFGVLRPIDLDNF